MHVHATMPPLSSILNLDPSATGPDVSSPLFARSIDLVRPVSSGAVSHYFLLSPVELTHTCRQIEYTLTIDRNCFC
jgi:hypothetical protein